MDILSTVDNFRWEGAPLSNVLAPAVGVVAYLLVVWALCRHMAALGVPYSVPRWLAAGHNVVLSVGSAIMFIGCVYELQRRWESTGTLGWVICEEITTAPATGGLFFWSYVYYLSKYYEFFDTFIGLLRGSRMPNFGLQVYHHVCVVFMAWFWCETVQSLQFPGLLFNTLVHVFMYAYYTCRVLKIRVPKVLKLGLTGLQIVQFGTSLIFLIFSLRVHVSRIKAREPGCAGYGRESLYSMWFNVIFNMTLLVSFVDVFKTNKKKKA